LIHVHLIRWKLNSCEKLATDVPFPSVDKGSHRVDHVNCARHSRECRNFLLGRSPEPIIISSEIAEIAGYFPPGFYLFLAATCVFDPTLTNPVCPETWASTHILPWFYAMPSVSSWLGGIVKTDKILEKCLAKRPCSAATNSLQVPVEMSVLSSQPFFMQSGTVDATQFGNIPVASFRSTKFFIPGGSDDGAVRTVRTARTANRRTAFARLRQRRDRYTTQNGPQNCESSFQPAVSSIWHYRRNQASKTRNPAL